MNTKQREVVIKLIKLKYTVGGSAYTNGRACIDDNGYVYDSEYPQSSSNAIGFIDSDGFVYPTARPVSRNEAVGNVDFSTWEIRSFNPGAYPSSGAVIGKGSSTGEVHATNVFGPVGYVEPADARGAAAILLLLQAGSAGTGDSGSYSSSAAASDAAHATGAGPAASSNIATGGSSGGGDAIGMICCVAIIILGILLKTKLFILGGLAFLIYTVVSNQKAKKKIDLHSLSPQVLFVGIFLGCFWGVASYVAGEWLVILTSGVTFQGSLGAQGAFEDGGHMHILIMSLMIGLGAALDMFYNAPTDKKEINMNTLTAGFFIVVFATGLLCLSLQVSLGLTVVILLVLFVLFLGGLFYIKKNK